MRLIDADALIKSCQDEKGVYFSYEAAVTADAVDHAPTADVVEVRHGEWKFDGEDWFCNKCNHNALCDKDTGEVVLSNACPNCGAKMGGGADER